MTPEVLLPDWPAPARVRALVTTRALGDMRSPQGREQLRKLLPAEPVWLKQVHGVRAVDATGVASGEASDASFTSRTGVVCAVMAADCMPVLLAEQSGAAVGVAHAGWRGLSAGVIESVIGEMRVPGDRLLAWLGPAIGPSAYEVGDEVRAAFIERDADAASAFASAGRRGHWMLDLYAVARQRLRARGVTRIHGGAFCTFTDRERFFSWRRDRAAERMAALIWLT